MRSAIVFAFAGFAVVLVHPAYSQGAPAEAQRARVSGRVFVSFMVDDAGFVRNVRIVKTDSPLFNQTVLEAVASLGRLSPGEQGGETVDVFYTVPVTFAIQ